MPKVGIILTDGTSFDFPVSDIFYDAWGSDTAEKYAKIESNGYESGEASLSLSGTAQLKIIKLPNNDTQVYWDDTLILGTYNSTTTISNLYILVNKYSNNAFGTFTFDRIMISKYVDTEPTYTISSAISNTSTCFYFSNDFVPSVSIVLQKGQPVATILEEFSLISSALSK
jgi:hypothetical protein